MRAARNNPQAPHLGETYRRLHHDGFPETLRGWRDEQHILFEGYPPLPHGWIRAWSRSVNRPYYVYLLCDPPTTTADLRDVLPPVMNGALPGVQTRSFSA